MEPIVGIYDVDFAVLDRPGVIRRPAEMVDRYRHAASGTSR